MTWLPPPENAHHNGGTQGDARRTMGFVKRLRQFLALASVLALAGCASEGRQRLAEPPALGLFPSPTAAVVPNPSDAGAAAVAPPASAQTPEAAAPQPQNPPKPD